MRTQNLNRNICIWIILFQRNQQKGFLYNKICWDFTLVSLVLLSIERTYLCPEKTMLDLEFQLGVKEVDVLKLWPDPNILKKSIGFSETLKSILV